jgi:hypothetical protein
MQEVCLPREANWRLVLRLGWLQTSGEPDASKGARPVRGDIASSPLHTGCGGAAPHRRLRVQVLPPLLVDYSVWGRCSSRVPTFFHSLRSFFQQRASLPYLSSAGPVTCRPPALPVSHSLTHCPISSRYGIIGDRATCQTARKGSRKGRRARPGQARPERSPGRGGRRNLPDLRRP